MGEKGSFRHVRGLPTTTIDVGEACFVRVKQIFNDDIFDGIAHHIPLPLDTPIAMEDVRSETLTNLATMTVFHGGKIALEFIISDSLSNLYNNLTVRDRNSLRYILSDSAETKQRE